MLNPCKNSESALLYGALKAVLSVFWFKSIDVNENLNIWNAATFACDNLHGKAFSRSTAVQSGDVHTHHSHEEGCRPFYACEPCTFTLPLDAHQLYEDVVGGAGLTKVRRGHLQFVLDHCGGLERKALW